MPVEDDDVVLLVDNGGPGTSKGVEEAKNARIARLEARLAKEQLQGQRQLQQQREQQRALEAKLAEEQWRRKQDEEQRRQDEERRKQQQQQSSSSAAGDVLLHAQLPAHWRPMTDEERMSDTAVCVLLPFKGGARVWGAWGGPPAGLYIGGPCGQGMQHGHVHADICGCWWSYAPALLTIRTVIGSNHHHPKRCSGND